MKRSIWKRLILLTLFGIAFGWLEAVAVAYIRKILEAEKTIDITRVFINQANSNLLRIEQTREVTTIIMLIALALLAFKDWRKRIAAFLCTFAIWDISYYLALKILIDWPPSLATIDCLFLIPCPWIAPVWLPLTAAIGMLMASMYLFLKGGKT